MLRVVVDDDANAEMRAGLDEVVLEGARRMLVATLEAEVDGYIEALAGELDEAGHRLVVRNGHAVACTITTAAGGIEIETPRVDDRRVDPETGQRCRFASVVVPPWCRKSPKAGCSEFGQGRALRGVPAGVVGWAVSPYEAIPGVDPESQRLVRNNGYAIAGLRRAGGGRGLGGKGDLDVEVASPGKQVGELVELPERRRGDYLAGEIVAARLPPPAWPKSFRILPVAHTSAHSLSAAARPRRMKRRTPRFSLAWPKTGSTVQERCP